MPAIKLNKSIRSAIARKMMAEKTKFGERSKKLAEERGQLAYELYDAYMGQDMPVVQRARPGMFDRKGYIYVTCGGETESLSFRDKNGASMELPFPDDKIDGGHNLSPSSNLGKKLQRLQREKRELSEERKQTLSEINAVLESCTTVGKLLEIWPEAKAVVESCIRKTESTALAVDMKKLNSRLDLP